MRTLPGIGGYVSNIQQAGDVGVGLSGKMAKQDLRAMGEGRIEQSNRMRPVLSAIQANRAASYKTAERGLSKDFGLDPALQAGMLTEMGGKLDENAGLQFANAAAGAYQGAESEFDKTKMFRDTTNLNAQEAAGRLYQSSFYDAAKKGGLLQDMMRAGVGAGMTMAGAAV